MADTEKNEDQKISRCLQEAFGYTDEQLLKQLDQANETLKDVTFDGAEDRIMKKIMARKAELEKETSAPEPETERNITLVKAETEDRKDKKIVRFGKKKVLATVALVAVIAGMLGGTAVGKRSYFFRIKDTDRSIMILDNAKNKQDLSEIEEVYKEIENQIQIPAIKLGYYPSGMLLDRYNISKDEAEIQFTYKNNYIGIIQAKKKKNYSTNLDSDREKKGFIFNEWIQANIEYREKDISDKEQEYEALLTYKDNFYYVFGIMEENEFVKIIKNINFY